MYCWDSGRLSRLTFDSVALVAFKKITPNRSEINKDIGSC